MEGASFAIFSAHTDWVELCLFDYSGKIEIARLELPEYTHEIWHGNVRASSPARSMVTVSTAPTIPRMATGSIQTNC